MTSKKDRQIRYAVVGLGNIAQVAVLPAFEHAKENSRLVALVSSDVEKLRELSEKYDVEVTGSYEDLENLVASHQIDAVYVAVPNTLHRTVVERAARAGAHVLCEKPMAVTEEDCAAMIAAAEEHGVKLMIAYRLHFDPANTSAIERVRAGEIGDPRIFSSVFCHQVQPGNIRTRKDLGGGALLDLGIYCVNAARYLFREEPTDVYAEQIFGTDERSEGVDEVTTAVLRFPGNRVAQFTASQGAANVAFLQVVGTDGELRLTGAYEYADVTKQAVVVEGKEETKAFGKRDQFAPELIHFSDCILNDEDPEPSGFEGLADVRIMEAMIRSARTGRRVGIPPVGVPERPDGSLAMSKPAVRRPEPVNAPAPSK